MLLHDPLILLLMVVFIVMLALIIRELAVRAGQLDGPQLFDGGCCEGGYDAGCCEGGIEGDEMNIKGALKY